MNVVKALGGLSVAAALALPAAAADSFQAPELSGQVFAYYRYELTKMDDAALEGANDFDVSRCYVNVMGAVGEKLAYRVTADITRPTTTTYRYALTQDPVTGDYTLEETASASRGPLSFIIKYAYCDVKDVVPNQSIYGGVVGLPWVDFENPIWGWRVIRKVAWDDRGYGPSADLGVGIGGKFADGLVTHHLAYANGGGYAAAENGLSGKDVTYRVSVYPLVKNDAWKGVSVSAVAKAGNIGEKAPAGMDKTPVAAYGGLVALERTFVNFGAGYFLRSEGAGDGKISGNLMSVYATGHLRATEGMTVHPLVRYDAYEPDKDTSDDERTLIIGGVGLKFFDEKLALIPNYQKESYKAVDAATGNVENNSTDYVYLHGQWDWK